MFEEDQNDITMIKWSFSVSDCGWSDQYELRMLYHRLGPDSPYEIFGLVLQSFTSYIYFVLSQFCFAYTAQHPFWCGHAMLSRPVPVSPVLRSQIQSSWERPWECLTDWPTIVPYSSTTSRLLFGLWGLRVNVKNNYFSFDQKPWGHTPPRRIFSPIDQRGHLLAPFLNRPIT